MSSHNLRTSSTVFVLCMCVCVRVCFGSFCVGCSNNFILFNKWNVAFRIDELKSIRNGRGLRKTFWHVLRTNCLLEICVEKEKKNTNGRRDRNKIKIKYRILEFPLCLNQQWNENGIGKNGMSNRAIFCSHCEWLQRWTWNGIKMQTKKKNRIN